MDGNIRDQKNTKVLIVAKCNVNKYKNYLLPLFCCVLIVAKCNVNFYDKYGTLLSSYVLIVAKCNVNKFLYFLFCCFLKY